MLIVLPPSEGKSVPSRGKPLDLPGLSFPTLGPARESVLDALVGLCSGDPDGAARVLGLGGTQADLVALDARLRTAPTARADRVYAGVLYDALDVATLSAAAKRRAGSRLAVTSSLFGLVRPPTGSRRTGSPATPRSPASGRWPGCGGTRSAPR